MKPGPGPQYNVLFLSYMVGFCVCFADMMSSVLLVGLNLSNNQATEPKRLPDLVDWTNLASTVTTHRTPPIMPMTSQHVTSQPETTHPVTAQLLPKSLTGKSNQVLNTGRAIPTQNIPVKSNLGLNMDRIITRHNLAIQRRNIDK